MPGYFSLAVVISALGVAHAGDLPDAPPPGTDITVLALTGQPAPDGHGVIAGLRTAAPLLNNQGQALFIADIHAPDIHIDAHAMLRSSRRDGMQQLLRTGEALPGGASFGWLRSTQDICLDDDGRVAVFVPDDADDQVVNLTYRLDPDGQAEVGGLEPPALPSPVFNELGQVVFYAQDAIMLAEADGSLRSVVRVGDELAGGRVQDIVFAGDEPCRRGFNDAGQVVFYARIASGADEQEGIFLAETR
jgi:hypothetical protein